MRRVFMLLLALLSLGSLALATAPTITSFTPSSGKVGTVVTVTGRYLATVPTTMINGTLQTANVNVTSITLTIAPGTVSGPITLTTADGNSVQSRAGTPIVLDPGLPVDVLPDGTVQQAGNAVGQIQLTSFDPGSLSKQGSNYFVAAPNAIPAPVTGTIVQGKLEQSNVGAAESAVRLVSITRQFEMLQKAAAIGNDLGKKAIEEVARVVS